MFLFENIKYQVEKYDLLLADLISATTRKKREEIRNTRWSQKGKLATIYMYCKHGSIHIAVAVVVVVAAAVVFSVSSDLICSIVRELI